MLVDQLYLVTGSFNWTFQAGKRKKHPLTMMACSSTSSPSPPSDFIIICFINDYKSDYYNYYNYYNLEHFIYQLVQDDESNGGISQVILSKAKTLKYMDRWNLRYIL
jgi:hypothetical protein